MFQSSPGLEAGCDIFLTAFKGGHMRFNPHPAWRPGATSRPRTRPGRMRVSILTRLGGRVRRFNFDFVCAGLPVSILTRLGGRVRRGVPDLCMMYPTRFQSSPGLEAGCDEKIEEELRNLEDVSILTRLGGRVRRDMPLFEEGVKRFQSSPGLEAGCDRPPQRAGCPTSRFNPHPAWRPGATMGWGLRVGAHIGFQSSPGLEAGCDVWMD